MKETPEESGERDFDLWKLDREAQAETHPAEFALKCRAGDPDAGSIRICQISSALPCGPAISARIFIVFPFCSRTFWLRIVSCWWLSGSCRYFQIFSIEASNTPSSRTYTIRFSSGTLDDVPATYTLYTI